MQERKTYFLDLQTLLTYLKGQSCELTTELKVSGKVARGSIVLEEGKVVHAQIVRQNGIQISGEQALKLLEAAAQWQVELVQPEKKEKAAPPPFLTPLTPSLDQPAASKGNLWPAPPLRQKGLLDPALLQNLPAKERLIVRSVFSLINGRRSCEEIKVQLPFASWDVERAVNRLRALDLVE